MRSAPTALLKKDYLTARFDYVLAMLEVERLLGAEILPSQ